MENAMRDHFHNHGKKEVSQEDKESCHWCQLRLFPRSHELPVTVVNNVDDTVLPPNFRFIASNLLRQGVEPAGDSFRSGCTCDNDTDCQFGDCLCLADVADETEETKKAYAYHSHGVKAGLLRSKMLDSVSPIYECHQGCACSTECPNRVVERGRTIPLEIFRTKDRGWGVRSSEDIKMGQFVDRYFGEVITAEEADKRRAASQISQRKDVYLFALDKFTDPKSLDPRLQRNPLEVDGEFASGPTRFVNHSCSPNLRIFARVGDHADKHLHDLALFATQDISRGTELTFDYKDGVSDEAEDCEFDPDHMTKCLCGSDNCRKYLWL